MSETTQVQKSANKNAKGLGRGLGSLLGPTNEGAFSKTTPAVDKAIEALATQKPSQPAPASVEEKKVEAAPVVAPAAPTVPAHLRLWQLPIEKLKANPNQPRQVFTKEALQDLANSIKEKGIIQPLLVRKTGEDSYEIIAGERRWRAAQLAGFKEVPALIKDSPEQEVLELALIENIQRENLNPVEEAEAYDFIIQKYNLTQQELAVKVGKERATIANMLRLLQLQPGVRQMLSSGEISMGQAKVLLSIDDLKVQEQLAQKAKSEKLSVRALEKLVAKAKEPVASNPSIAKDIRALAVDELQDELQKLIGSKVVLDYDSGKGRIIVHFYSDDELNQIADTLRDSWRK